MCITAGPAWADSGLTDLGLLGDETLLSADGSTLGSIYRLGSDGLYHSDIWTAENGVRNIGTLGDETILSGLSADGSVAAGTAFTRGGGAVAFRWTTGAGIESLSSLGGVSSLAHAISADGKVIVGASDLANGEQRAVRWTTQGVTDLGTLAGGSDSYALATNTDGAVVVGGSLVSGHAHAFRWTNGVMSDLGTLGGSYSIASAVSASGQTVAGESYNSLGQARAFVWTTESAMRDIGTLGGTRTYFADLSSDGTAVVGASDTGTATHAYRWTASSGISSLGTLGDNGSWAFAVNADGSVVVGEFDLGQRNRGFRWTQETGMQTIEQWLGASEVNIDPSSSQVAYAEAVSDDGSVVAGILLNDHTFIARVGEPGGGTSGMIDLQEFSASLDATAAAPTAALANTDMILNGAHGSPMRNLVPEGRYSVWTGGDYGQQDDTDSDQSSLEVGVATNIGNGVQLNVAIGRSYAESETGLGGETKLRGTYLMPEAIIKLGGFPLYATVSGFYSAGDADIDRGYRNAGAIVQSHGETDVTIAGGKLRLDWLNAFAVGATSFTPYTSVGHVKAKFDGYSETGGGFPVRWEDRTERTTTGRVGLDAVHTFSPTVNLLGRLEGVHRFDDESGSASGELIGLSTFELPGQAYRQNWVRAAVGAEAALGGGVGSLMLNGTSEGGDADYWLALNYKWLL
ncbi:autotransporter domain-containing protein [Pseudomonas stutzeri]|uniref:autotransporter domain-containing protein n=1 Tax=Stutzerimonas stutzeri TaxID=316 RepID=UPI00210D0267|nr:autotransporter domain-containing protein [Stutzerimonas stutzeri]MCQ4312327.1 autotransporter domain-containing protein [Stutzerimonas stutzeri]